MALTNFSGAIDAPGITSFQSSLSGISFLKAAFRVPSAETIFDAQGRVITVQSYAHGGPSKAFGASGTGLSVVRREGVNGVLLEDRTLEGPTSDFGNNSKLTMFALFHVPSGEGNGSILGDTSGTRMGIELGGLKDFVDTKLRARSTATLEFIIGTGWHWMVYEHDNNVGKAQVDGGLQRSGATAVDGNLFQIGMSSNAPSTVALAAWGYALAPLISNGQSVIVDNWFRHILGARTI